MFQFSYRISNFALRKFIYRLTKQNRCLKNRSVGLHYQQNDINLTNSL